MSAHSPHIFGVTECLLHDNIYDSEITPHMSQSSLLIDVMEEEEPLPNFVAWLFLSCLWRLDKLREMDAVYSLARLTTHTFIYKQTP